MGLKKREKYIATLATDMYTIYIYIYIYISYTAMLTARVIDLQATQNP